MPNFHFHFKGLEEEKDLQRLINFLLLQGLGYKNYEDWVQRTEHELEAGYKKVILAFSYNYLVADVIYQQHKEIPLFLELKNMRVHPDFRMREFGRFMLKQPEIEAKGRYDAIICDLPARETGIMNFLTSCGYKPLAISPLYDPNTNDLTMIKLLNNQEETSIFQNAKNFILSKSL